uniref:Uncharacterized protein n=1 Tax=Anguilla anguilla TaxID=7936 RepID=A0A0E9QAA5_ANGAN
MIKELGVCGDIPERCSYRAKGG